SREPDQPAHHRRSDEPAPARYDNPHENPRFRAELPTDLMTLARARIMMATTGMFMCLPNS
ncbi:hypothetical protein JUN65_16615, partial [Gluconacetobacter azotocaptans]|uniref:hypothetical protein n=1 Tax=Gluconacetobacter azotocaptans TaxID=142834 RepID=UPI0019571962